jgi:hypothetical protein
MDFTSSASLVNVSTPITTNITTSNNYEYFGFKVYVHDLILNTSVGLRVNIAYLLNGGLDPGNFRNDGTYSYDTRYVVLSGTDYTNWASDDNYITTWVSNNFQSVIDSKLSMPHLMFHLNEI